MGKHWRDVRSQQGNKLLFRFCAETEEIEIRTPLGRIEIIAPNDFRPPHRRVKETVDKQEHLCYAEVVITGWSSG